MKEFDEIDEMLEEDEEDEGIITLYNETTNKDEDFYHLATLDHEDKWYIVLSPVEASDDLKEDECLIYELVSNENGDDELKAIEDEKLLDEVYAKFEALMSEYED